MKPVFTVLVGLPGSGKSTYAKSISENNVIVSTDAIRKEFGDINDQSINQEVFTLAHKRIREYLSKGENVVFDACNVSRKSRKTLLHSIGKIDCYKKCLVVWQPVDVCKNRNSQRERVVPEEVINKMVKRFDTPALFEGFDEIGFANEFDKTDPFDDYLEYYGFDQKNSHHKLVLGEHLKDTHWYISTHGCKDRDLKLAALMHDIGKPFTQEYDDKKGECTYYNHHNVGAYIALGYDYTNATDVFMISLLINLHMYPYFWQGSDYPEQTAEKYKKLWGDELFDKVMMLHEADKAAH